MKKIMICLIALIPIVIIGIVQLSVKIIVSTNHIYVDNVVLGDTQQVFKKTSDEPLVYQMKPTIYPLSASSKKLKFESSNEDIARVDETGLVTFIAFGRVTIFAFSSENSKIFDSKEFFIYDDKVHEVRITNKIDTMYVGDKFSLQTIIIPNEAINKKLNFFSSNESAVKVSPNGVATAVATGKSTISAVSQDGNKMDSFEVRAIAKSTAIEIEEKDQFILTALNDFRFPNFKVLPSDASQSEVKFSSLNENAATISKEGLIHFNLVGTVTFVVETLDGFARNSIDVTYTAGYPVNIELNPKTIEMNFEKNKQLQINALLTPNDADLRNVTLVSSNELVVKIVDNEAFVVGGGKAIITAIAQTGFGQINAVCSVNINRDAEEVKFFNDEVEIEMLTTNVDECKINAVVLPADTTDKSLNYVSLNENLATVSDKGIVKFLNYGDVEIVATTANGIKKTIKIKYVPSAAKEIKISDTISNIEIAYGNVFYLKFEESFNVVNPTFSLGSADILSRQGTLFQTKMGGNEIITVTSKERIFTINIKVVRFATDFSFKINNAEPNEDLFSANTEFVFETSIFPADTTTKAPILIVDRPDIASFSSQKLVFSKGGKVKITLNVDGILKHIFIESTFNTIKDFEIEGGDVVLDDLGMTSKINIGDISPSDYAFDLSQFSFISLNPSIATVSQNGTIQAIGKGKTTVNVSAFGVTKSINVEVKIKSKQIDFIYQDKLISNGKVYHESINLDTKILPENTSNKTVVFEILSGNATITNEGLVTFLGNGEVVVRATCLDSGISKNITLTKISSVEKLVVFDGLNQTNEIIILPNANFKIVNLVASAENLLDSLDDIEFAYNIESPDELQIVIKDLGGGYYQINTNNNGNKMLTATVTFSIKHNNGQNNAVNAPLKIKAKYLTGIELELKNADDIKFGLEQRRVFGTRSIKNGEIVNTLTVPYKLYPENSADVVYWFSDNINIATVENGVITFVEQTVNEYQALKITVGDEPVLSECTLTSSYIFTLVNAVNTHSNEDFTLLVTTNLPIALHLNLCSDFDLTTNAVSIPRAKFTLDFMEASKWVCFDLILYGNGYLLNFNDIFKEKKILPNLSGTVKNILIRGHNFDESKKSYEAILGLQNITIEYAVIENFKRGLSIGGEVVARLKNVFLRYMKEYALIVFGTNPNVYLENIIIQDAGTSAVDYQAGKIFCKGLIEIYNFRSASDYPLEYKAAISKIIKDNPNYVVDGKINIAFISAKFFGTPGADTVYFWNEALSSYEGNVANENGLTKIYVNATVATANAWLYPNTHDIKPDSIPDPAKIYRLG